MLENKLEDLIVAVDRLIVVMGQLLEQQPVAAPTPEPAPVAACAPTPEPAPTTLPEQSTADKPAESAITKDSLQDYALGRVRDEGKAFKAKLVDALGKYGAKTISQLPDDEAAKVVYAVIGGGK